MDLPLHASRERDHITMMRTMTVVRQYLAAAFLLVIGLIAYGCGDSATVSEPAALGSLSISPGTLQPPFDPSTTDYTAKISSNVSSATITATPRVAGDSIQIDNQQITNRTVTLASPGDKTTVTIVVTDTGAGGASKSYKVEVERQTEDTTLRALSVSPGTLAPSTFDKDRPDYTVNDVANTVTSITISATKSDQNTVMQINSPSGSVNVPAGTALGEAPVRLGGTGSATTVSIVVTARGGSSNTYTVTINRGPSDNKFLRSLSIASGSTALTLVPRFSQTAPDYTVNVASTIGSVSVTPRLDDETTARMTVNGVATDSRDRRTITLNPAGPRPSPTPIPIVVTAQNGSQQRYLVTVIRAALNGNNDLRSLTVSPGNLTFDPDDQDYTVSPLSDVTSVRITAAPRDSNARVTINGQPSPTNINLGAPGPETRITIPIVVTAQNNDTKTYNVTLIRAALGGNNNLRSLAVSQPGLSPSPFSADRTVYRLNVGNNIDSITVTASPQVTSSSMSMKVNNGAPINLTAGQASPSISLAPVPSDTEIEIIVRAQNQSEKPYVITVTRAAASSNDNLSELRVNGSSVPGFTQGTLSYTVNVASDVNEVTVSATKADRDATMAIGSVTVAPGTATGQGTFPLNGAGGPPTPISVTVTAQNGGAPNTYTITINRALAEPLAPTIAPDLITADDSCEPNDVIGGDPNECLPPTSREDNITNVPTPRFSIPQPGAGETATLYINGNKDASSSTTGNLLTPSTSLPVGVYNITYTLTNAGGESDQSPIMMTPPPQLQKLRIITTPPPPPNG